LLPVFLILAIVLKLLLQPVSSLRPFSLTFSTFLSQLFIFPILAIFFRLLSLSLQVLPAFKSPIEPSIIVFFHSPITPSIPFLFLLSISISLLLLSSLFQFSLFQSSLFASLASLSLEHAFFPPVLLQASSTYQSASISQSSSKAHKPPSSPSPSQSSSTSNY